MELFFSSVVRSWLTLMGLLLVSAAQAGWVDSDLDDPADRTVRRSHRDGAGPASSIDLLLNLQGSGARGTPTVGSQGQLMNRVWPGPGGGQIVDPFGTPGTFMSASGSTVGRSGGSGFASGSVSPFGVALGSQSAQGAGLFGSGAIPAASTWAQNFRLGVAPTSLYGGATATPQVDERALVRRVNLPVHYESGPGTVEVFVRWMQENRVFIIAGSLLLLLLLGLGSMAIGSRR